MNDTIAEIINRFELSKSISDADFELVINYYRREIIDFLLTRNNHDFATCFLKKAISKRRNDPSLISLEDLQFAAYLLAIHKNVSDSLLIYEAKSLDFDTNCGFDIQLTVSSGVQETLNFMESFSAYDTKKFIKYIKDCQQSGDFDELEQYYSQTQLPWYI